MSNSNKYIILATIFVISVFTLFYPIDVFSQKGIELQKQILLKQAQTHFRDQVNTRSWNARYGGVYVKPLEGQKPNPYLTNNTLRVDENLTLIKINPAWMTRQLSEVSNIKDFHFRITSLIPINPNNKATPFEQRALKYIERTNKKEYFEINKDSKFNYMGALVTKKACLPCHKHQGYVLGDIRGGISISLNSEEYQTATSSIQNRALVLKIFVIFFLLSIVLLIYKQLRHSEKLEEKVRNRTSEILSTKLLLQEVLDTDLSFLMVSNETEIILANKTMLDFFDFETLDKFKEQYKHISNAFEKVDDENFLCTYVKDEHWIDFLQREQNNRELKVLMKKDGINRYFKPHAKKVVIENQELHIIIFDEITKELKKIQILKDEASKDSLTKLFNKGKFNEVLSQEIALSQTTSSPLSIIFLDIDLFKIVNDTYGHDVGDYILIELAKILKSTIRTGDFVARWGGEEFVITLQSTDSKQASLLAEKIRKNVEMHSFTKGGGQTISLGVTQYLDNESQEGFTKRVDEALYEAKETGRNKVIVK